MNVDPIIATLNVALCAGRFYSTMRRGRLMATAWFLMTYFAVFFIPLSFEHEINWIRGFYAEHAIANKATIHQAIVYTLAFNTIFALAEAALWRLLPKPIQQFNWLLPRRDRAHNRLLIALAVMWAIGSVWYFWHSRTQGYRDYVEGADWSVVIFWASSPVIALAAMQKRRIAAAIFCIPFLYFALHLAVRSFALLSLVPLLMVGFYQVANNSQSRARLRKMLRYIVVGGALLVAVSIVVSQFKTGEVAFPDSGMPYGVAETMAMVDKFDEHVGFNGLTLYGVHYVNPFMRLFHIPQPELDDTPVVIARLLDGVPPKWPVYFHYPALIWTDAYISFGWNGLWLAVFWAAVLCIWDFIMLRYPLLCPMLLPYFIWHNYMLVRGAIAVASVPISYSLYFSFFIFVLILGRKILRRGFANRQSNQLRINSTASYAVSAS